MKKCIYYSFILFVTIGCVAATNEESRQDDTPLSKPWLYRCFDLKQTDEGSALIAGKVKQGTYPDNHYFIKSDNGDGIHLLDAVNVNSPLHQYLNTDQYVLLKATVVSHTIGGVLTGDPEKDRHSVRRSEHFRLKYILNVDDKPILPDDNKGFCGK